MQLINFAFNVSEYLLQLDGLVVVYILPVMNMLPHGYRCQFERSSYNYV